MYGKMVRKTGDRRKRLQRATSNIFANFEQAQLEEFKEAFNMMDVNRDGFIDKDDLADLFASFGRENDNEILESMVNEANGPINFPMFLSLFGEKMGATDPEATIRNAFAILDDNNCGFLEEGKLREMLMTMGDRFTEDDVDEVLRSVPIENGKLDYSKLTRIIKHGELSNS